MALAAYASLADLKARLGETTSERDAALTNFLLDATDAIEQFTGRDFGPGTRTERGRGYGPFIMPKASPIDSVTSFTINGDSVTPVIELGGTAVSAKERTLIDGEWVLVYVTSEPVPRSVQAATLMTAQAMSEAPAFDLNMTGISINGVVQGGFHQAGAGAIPPGAQTLLQPFVPTWKP